MPLPQRQRASPIPRLIVAVLLIVALAAAGLWLFQLTRSGNARSFIAWCNEMVAMNHGAPPLRSTELASEGAGRMRGFDSVNTCLETQRPAYIADQMKRR